MIKTVSECTSTNSAIDRNSPHGDALMAIAQTAGRGQRGNSWEAAPGLNITLSLMLRPRELHASRQFAVSEAVALGVADLLTELGLTGVKVKWPNDVYVANGKIAGILIAQLAHPGWNDCPEHSRDRAERESDRIYQRCAQPRIGEAANRSPP